MLKQVTVIATSKAAITPPFKLLVLLGPCSCRHACSKQSSIRLPHACWPSLSRSGSLVVSASLAFTISCVIRLSTLLVLCTHLLTCMIQNWRLNCVQGQGSGSGISNLECLHAHKGGTAQLGRGPMELSAQLFPVLHRKKQQQYLSSRGM